VGDQPPIFFVCLEAIMGVLGGLIHYFIIVAASVSVASGFFNALLFYTKSFFRHKPKTMRDNVHLIGQSLVFGLVSALMTIGIISSVAACSYPFFSSSLDG
jgi:hypothetical protein